ncbi:MAG: polysaccharide deacetylase family protein [Clostridia bacterium]|nr:polysaccharide deacetylase family protein [Clostridia bacterium]
MKIRKILLPVVSAAALLLALWAGFNIAVDPFGVFGASALRWDSYAMTLCPKGAKPAYVAAHPEKYDSFIIGSAPAASFSVGTLNGYSGASFYNMSHPDSDTGYDRQLVGWLVGRGGVKNVLLVVGLEDADADGTARTLAEKGAASVTGESPVSYYLSYAFADPGYALSKLRARKSDRILPEPFDSVVPETGCADGRRAAGEAIGTLDAYLSERPGVFEARDARDGLSTADKCISDVAAIKEICDGAGVRLTVVVPPVHESEAGRYSDGTLDDFFSRLAAVTDYFNFAVSPVSADARYFLTGTTPRESTADMAAAAIYGDGSRFVPEGFGYRASDGAAVPVSEMRRSPEIPSGRLAVLMYHHIADGGVENDYIVSEETLARHLDLLLENGYTPVGVGDLTAFVENGRPLPERPVLITFDDGYLSNYESAFPLLRERGVKAAVFVVGSSAGKDTYRDTDIPITPHFGAAEAREMESSGTITIGSHTFDMHRWAEYETEQPVRSNILPFEDEDEDDYARALAADDEAERSWFASAGLSAPIALAFPEGKRAAVTDAVLVSLGYRVTFTTDAGRVNELLPGVPGTLLDLGRITVPERFSDGELLFYLSGAENIAN